MKISKKLKQFIISNLNQINMQQEKRNQKVPVNQSTLHYQYEVCEVQSAGCIKKYGMYVSQPWKYAGTHILLHCGMVLYYYATFSYLHLALGIISAIVHCLCTTVLIKLAFTDPGMIPKILPNYQKQGYQQIPTNYHRYASLLRYYQKHYRTVIQGHNLQLKFCNTCYIYRPPRTVHCEDCGICIEKFDHHCPWIGTCVAKRNYKYFLFFLTVLSILTVKIFIECIVISVEYSLWDNSQVIAKSVINIFLCIYIFPAMGFAVFMLVLHLKFVTTNVTTNEFCKQTWQTLQGNPFKKKSWLKNIFKTVSLHYQGKVNFDQRIYSRDSKIIPQSDSLNSLNDTKGVIRQNDNINSVHEFKSRTHQNYSTNDHTEIEKQHDIEGYNNPVDNHQKKTQKMIKGMQNYQRTQKRQRVAQLYTNNQQQYQQQQHHPPPNDNAISIYDISLRLHSKTNNQQYQRSTTKENQYQSSSSQSSSQKANTSILSQKDKQQYTNNNENQFKQQERKLKVIVQENQNEIYQQQAICQQPLQQRVRQHVS